MKRLLSAFFLGVLCSVAYPQQQDVTPTTALDAYLNNGDRTWAYEVLSSYPAGNTQAYSLLLVSQKWQGILWKHELIVFVPKKVAVDGALLFIGGSAVQDNMPKFAKPDDGTSQAMALIAEKNNAIAGILRQVPNQPLYGNLSEDALISYTLNEFRRNSDYSLPLLFPMVKSAIRAMDAIQEFAKETTRTDIKRFVVSGMSKRGWTTWLTGASQDPRVVAIVPMVIDMLNMPITLEYQKELYGGVYSEEIQDYVKLGIPQAVASDFGKSIVQMIDPYCYQAKLNMPKMLVMGTNDPYWTLDAVKHYIDDIPGQNFLSYVPNAEHGLGDRQQALNALNAFFGLTVAGKPYPRCEWTLKEQRGKASIEIQASPDELVSAALWTADSPTRDFRSSKWTSSEIALKTKHLISTTVKYPKKDFSAFYVELVYKDANGGEYSVTTRPYIADTKHIFVK
ncbi:MAG: PhoPQ-activated pathogenicity-related family protein [Tannerella sp.]|jgi:PhoPQ-activated pathogenicity-related protein|nr:PhoPQ-activated pathogenicity-related family protein [Tannerella sp.]